MRPYIDALVLTIVLSYYGSGLAIGTNLSDLYGGAFQRYVSLLRQDPEKSC